MKGLRKDMSPTKEVASGGSTAELPLVARYLSFLPNSLTYLSLIYLHRSLASSTAPKWAITRQSVSTTFAYLLTSFIDEMRRQIKRELTGFADSVGYLLPGRVAQLVVFVRFCRTGVENFVLADFFDQQLVGRAGRSQRGHHHVRRMTNVWSRGRKTGALLKMRRRELEAARTRTADGEELWKSTNCQTVGDALNGHRRRRHHHHRQLLSSLPPAQPSGGLRSTCPPSHRKKPSGSSGLPVRSLSPLSLSLSLPFLHRLLSRPDGDEARRAARLAGRDSYRP